MIYVLSFLGGFLGSAGVRLIFDHFTRRPAITKDMVEVLHDALKAQHDALDSLMAKVIMLDRTFLPSKSPEWDAVVRGNEAIKVLERRIGL